MQNFTSICTLTKRKFLFSINLISGKMFNDFNRKKLLKTNVIIIIKEKKISIMYWDVVLY